MSTVFLLPDNPAIRPFVFDLTRSEQHNFVSKLTKNPIEDGSTVTDQVVVDPASFSCTVCISNTPIETTFEGEGSIGPISLRMPGMPPSTIGTALLLNAPPIDARPHQAVGLAFGPFKDRVKWMLDRLNILRTTVQTVTVLTSKHQYDSMVLTTISLPIERVNTGEFTLTFEELIVVSSDQVTAPKPKEPRGAPMSAAATSNPAQDQLDQAQKMFESFKNNSALRAIAVAAGLG